VLWNRIFDFFDQTITLEGNMGKLDTFLSFVDVGLNVAQIGQLEQLKRQGMASALRESLLKQLRDMIFTFKQKAETILRFEDQDKLRTACALQLLQNELDETGISPELFPELLDKEYVANTIRLIRENNSRLLSYLSPEEIDSISNIVRISDQLEEHSFYVGNYDNYKKLQNSKKSLEDAKGKRNLAFIAFFCLMFFLCISMDNFSMIIPIAMIVMLIIGASFTGLVNTNKKTVEEITNIINEKEMKRLDEKFSGDIEKVKSLYEENKGIIAQFFGESPILEI
jgi:hypothetical protein